MAALKCLSRAGCYFDPPTLDGFAAAKMAIVTEVRESFRAHPEVMDKVCEIVEEATRKFEERVE